jgi:hypothetical protein
LSCYTTIISQTARKSGGWNNRGTRDFMSHLHIPQSPLNISMKSVGFGRLLSGVGQPGCASASGALLSVVWERKHLRQAVQRLAILWRFGPRSNRSTSHSTATGSICACFAKLSLCQSHRCGMERGVEISVVENVGLMRLSSRFHLLRSYSLAYASHNILYTAFRNYIPCQVS